MDGHGTGEGALRSHRDGEPEMGTAEMNKPPRSSRITPWSIRNWACTHPGTLFSAWTQSSISGADPTSASRQRRAGSPPWALPSISRSLFLPYSPHLSASLCLDAGTCTYTNYLFCANKEVIKYIKRDLTSVQWLLRVRGCETRKENLPSSKCWELLPWEELHLHICSLVAQPVKNLPAMQETLVQFLGQEDPLEKGKATHSSILGLPWWLRW